MEAYIVNKFTGISHIDSNITNSNNTANNRNTNGDGFDDFVLALSWLIVKNTQYSSLLMDYLVLAIIKHYPVWFNHLSTNSFLDKAGEDSKVIHPLFHVLKLLSCGNFVQKEKAKSPPAITATTNATASSKAKDIQSGDDQEIFKSILAYVAGNDESEFASLLGSFKQISNFEFKKDYGKSKSFGWIKTLSAALYIVSLIFSSNSDSKRLFRVSFVEFLIGFGISFRNGLQENDQQLFNKDTITLWYLEQAIKSFCNSYISVNSAYYSSMAIDNQFSIQLNIENQKESDLWYDNPWSLHEFINKESDFDGSKIIELLKLRPDLFVNISGYFLPIRRESSKKEASAQHVEEVIISTTTAKNLQGLSLAVLDSVSSFRPILVQGTAGSGKTTLLYHLAQQTGNVNTLVELQIDDQMDSKTLLGTYVCTDVPGEFKWQPGTLTQALQKGYWVVIEDIDRVPFEVLSALVSLFENGSLLLPNRNETIYAAPGFCLFATRTVLAPILKGDNSSQADTSSPASSMFSNLWTIVNIESLPKEELKDVALQRYSEEYNKKYRIPKDIIEKMLETFDAISEFYSAEKKSQMDRVISEQSGIQSSQKSLSSFSRQFFIKDLFKWLDRVGTNIKNQSLTLSSSVAPSNASSSNNNNKASLFVTESQKQDILLEALDCFGASLPSVEQRLLLADRISVIWNLAIAHMRDIYLLKSRKPIVDIVIKSSNATDNKIGKVCFRRVGRSYLPIPENAKIPSAPTLAQTAVFLRTIEQISVCVSLFEPVLLVGETGAGKTAILQQLATLCGRKLIVQNMHIQSDGSELLGGYKPVDLFHIAKPLHNDFLDLFQTLFQADDNGPFLKSISEALEKRKWKLFSKALSKACSKAFQRLDSEQQQDESSSSQGSGNSQKSKKQKGNHGKQASISAHDQEEVQDLIEKKEKWQELQKKAEDFDRIRSKVEGSFAFEFEEGALVKAVRNGDWILLDEINLASSETLERLSGLLDSHAFSSLTLTERGDLKKIERHPNFRIFAAMNPATDAGKKDLPPAVRHRFTEIFVDEVEEKSDLQQVVMQFIGHIASPPVTEVVNIYLNARKQSSIGKLVDGAGQSARFSLRTLTRALSTALVFLDRGFGLARSLYESFLMTFVTLLNEASADTLRKEIKKAFIPDMSSEELDAPSKRPSGAANKDEVYVPCGKYWIPQGPISSSQTTNEATIAASSSQKKSKKKAHPQFDADPSDDSFIITPSVARSVDSVARAIAARKYPILLQGPTSTGKTSMVVYLANRTGNKCVRINNHEHTDLQEYLGSYVSDPQTGQLVFKEGILAEAVRNGYWIILDELNLAPSEVLEALNRLLDDNRELYIPETQETLKPHKHFMLFATQNPPGLYGGRKILSRAFRNRFLEIQIDEIPHKELQTILERRTKLAPKFCELMIKIMDELQKTRQQSRIFAGKDGYITVRDLLRWADRNPTSKEDVAVDGFRLLGERIRVSSEKDVVRKIIEKNCEIDLLASFNSSLQLPFDNLSGNDLTSIVGGHNIVWTKSMRRLFALVNRCVEKSEPVLLVGETGCGKTTICQVLSYINQQQLQILNCHQNTETADFLGSLRPIRGRDLHTNRLKEVIQEFYRIIPESIKNEYFNTQIKDDSKTVSKKKRSSPNADNEKEAEDIPGEGKLLQGDITHIQEIYKIFATSQSIGNENTELDKLLVEINELNGKVHGLFEWQDGPLITSMKQGSYILLDELSLAEDAVLERLNSLLEPSRTIVLAERAGGKEADQIVKAHSNFRLFATMNPGGDFGKRELSPALRNRFTEIWIPPITDDEELIEIVQDFFINHLENNMMNWSDLIPKRMVTFISWFNTNCSKYSSTIPIITLRDMLSWSDFICLLSKSKIFNFMEMETKLWEFYIHGAFLCILDGLGLGAGTSLDVAKNFRAECFDFLINQIPENIRSDEDVHEKIISIAGNKQSRKSLAFEIKDSESEEYKLFGHCPFYIPVNKQTLSGNGLKSYALEAPTTGKNAFKVLRAMQLKRPILIEGSPGVGKTSLITALAACCGQTLIRINLSEQTDFSDLIGADLPATANEQENNESSSKTSSQFRWSDGVFLTAIKNGYWVLLDELNLASQTVLEGLNAVLDHRGSVYVPELNQTFVCPPSFRVFGAQNPLQQGGGRKGLPKSFLNRFTKVYVDTLQREDMVMIMQKIHPKLSNQIERLVDFNESIVDDVCNKKLYGRMGSPWEFNLRDVFRCCDLMDNINVEESPKKTTRWLVNHMDLLYLQRMRTGNDRILLRQRMESFFGAEDVSSILDISPDVYYTFSPEPTLVVGDVAIQCKERSMPVELNRSVLPTALYSPLKGIARCIQKSWPVLLLGPPGSGKTSCLNYLSKMTGNPLHVIALTSSTDSTELLGCFEQVDPFRKERKILDKCLLLLDDAISLVLEGYGFTYKGLNTSSNLQHLMSFKIRIEQIKSSESNSSNKNSTSSEFEHHKFSEKIIANIIQLARSVVESHQSIKFVIASDVLEKASELEKDVKAFAKNKKLASVSASFEWVDGVLIRALENGEWVALENANLCSPTTLDRLNPLLEPNGELLVNECGMIDGQPRIVKPHPNFRLFLIADPQHGEVSRAMRNRCVEISLVPTSYSTEKSILPLSNSANEAIQAFHTKEKKEASADSRKFHDFAKIVNGNRFSSFIIAKYLPFMFQIHSKMCSSNSKFKSKKSSNDDEHSNTKTPNARHLLHWIRIFPLHLKNHTELPSSSTLISSFKASFELAYSAFSTTAQNEAKKLVDAFTPSSLTYYENAIVGIYNYNNGIRELLLIKSIDLKQENVNMFRDYMNLNSSYVDQELLCLHLLSQVSSITGALIASDIFASLECTKRFLHMLPLHGENSNALNFEKSLPLLFCYHFFVRLSPALVLKLKDMLLLSSFFKSTENSVSQQMKGCIQDLIQGVLLFDQDERANGFHPLIQSLINLRSSQKIFNGDHVPFVAALHDEYLGLYKQIFEEDKHILYLESLVDLYFIRIIRSVYEKQFLEMDDDIRSFTMNKYVPEKIRKRLLDFFITFAKFEKLMFLSVTNANIDIRISIFSLVSECLYFRDSLWDQVYSSKYLLSRQKSKSYFSELAITWRWLMKRLVKIFNTCIENSLLDMELSDISHLFNIVGQIDSQMPTKSVKISEGAKEIEYISNAKYAWKKNLWKNGGHPLANRTKEACNSVKNLLKIESQIDFKKDEAVFIYERCTPAEIRRYIVEANCAIRFFNSNYFFNEIQSEENSLENTNEAIAVVQEQMKKLSEDCQNGYESLTSILNPAYEKIGEKMVLRKALKEQLWPVVDSMLSKRESLSLVKISSFISPAMNSIAYQEKLEHAVISIESFLNLAIEVGSKLPSLLSCYNQFIWMNHEGSKSANKKQLLEQSRDLLSEMVISLFMTSFRENFDIEGNSSNTDNEILYPNLNEQSIGANLTYSKKNRMNATGAILEGFSRGSISTGYTYKFVIGSGLGVDKLRANDKKWSSIIKSNPISLKDWQARSLQLLLFFSYQLEFSNEVFQIQTSEQQLVKNLLNSTLLHTWETVNIEEISKFEGAVDLMNKCDARSILSHLDNQHMSEQDIALTWIKLGLLKMCLYMPISSIDPVLKPNVEYRHLSGSYEQNLMLENVASILKLLRAGSVKTEFRNKLASVLDNIIHSMADASKKIVYRDDEFSYSDMQSDFLAFANDICSCDKVLATCERIRKLSSAKISFDEAQKIQNEEYNFQVSALNFLEQMFTKYSTGVAMDVLYPFCTSIIHIMHGMRLLVEANIKGTENDKGAIFTKLIGFPMHVEPSFDLLENSQRLRDKNLRSQILKSSLIRTQVEVSEDERHNQDQFKTISKIFDMYVEQWKFDKEEEEKKRREDAALFKTVVRAPKVEDMQTEEDEIEFRNMFPDFHAEFEINRDPDTFAPFSSNINNNSTNGNDNNDRNGDTSVFIDKQHDYLLVGKAFLEMFGDKKSKNIIGEESATSSKASKKKSRKNRNTESNFKHEISHKRLESFTQSYQSGYHFLSNGGAKNELLSLPGNIDKATMSSNLTALSLCLGDINSHIVGSDDEDSESTILDIYQETDVSEIIRLSNPLKSTLKRVGELLKDWPDNAILMHIANLTDKIQRLPLQSPLMRSLVGIEVLLAKMNEWEIIAHKGVSLAEQIKAVSNLVFRWRKLELKSWQKVLDTKDKESSQTALRFWFSLYNSIQSSLVGLNKFKQSSDANIEEDDDDKGAKESEEKRKLLATFFQTIDQFMRSSSVAEFETRLKMLFAFAKYCRLRENNDFFLAEEKGSSISSKSSNERVLSNIVLNIASYYDQWSETIKQTLLEHRKEAETKLLEFAKIASWDRQSYYSLKESAEKSHRKIHKISKDYETSVKIPIHPIIEKQSDTGVTQSQAQFTLVVKIDDIESKIEPDSASVSKLATSKKKKDADQLNVLENPLYMYQPHDQDYLGREKTILQQHFQKQKYISSFNRYQKKGLQIFHSFWESRLSVAQQESLNIPRDLCLTIAERIKNLRKPSVSVQAKQLAFKDLIQGLQDNGFKTVLNSASSSLIRNIQKLFARDPPRYEFDIEHQPSVRDTDMRRMFFTSLSQTNRLRLTVTSVGCHPDIDRIEANRALGLTESFFELLLQQREFLNKIRQQKQLIERHSRCISRLCSTNHGSSNRLIKIKSGTPLYDAVLNHCDHLNSIISGLRDLKFFLHNLSKIFGSKVLELEKELLGFFNEDGAKRTKEVIEKTLADAKNFLDKCDIQIVNADSCEKEIHHCYERIKLIIDDIYLCHESLHAEEAIVSISESDLEMFRQNVLDLHTCFANNFKDYFPSVNEQIRECTGVENVLYEFFSFARDIVQIKMGPLTKEISDFDKNDMDESVFSNEFEALAKDIILSIQSLALSEPLKGENAERKLRDIFEIDFQDALNGLRVSKLSKSLVSVCRVLRKAISSSPNSEEVKYLVEKFSKSIQQLLLGTIQTLEIIESQFEDFNQKCCELHLLVSRVIRTAIAKGFCRPNEEKEGQDADGDGDGGEGNDNGDDDNDDNLQDGTGFGEGKGKKNVSNEVEDEEQLLGLKKEDADDDEEEKEKKDKRDDSKEEEEDNDDPNKDDAVDMENDFEGDIHDEDKKENENNSDEDDDDGEDEEELDREMGDLGDDKEAVDEKLWGNDSDDEEEEIDKENEKYEKDAPMKSNDEQEDEMRAKDDKEEEEGEGNNHDEDDGEESKQEQKNKQRDEEGQEDEENNNENDGDDGEKEDEKVNRDDLDNEIEKNQLPMPPEENEEEDGEEGTEREPDAPPEIGDDDLDLPSNPDEDENEEEENAENGMDIENEEHGDEQDSENHDSDAENDEDQEKDKNKVDEDNTSIGSTDNPDKEENPDNLSKNKENESNKELIPAPFSMDIDKPSNSIDTGATEEEKNEKKKNSSLQGKEESNADNDESNAKGSIGNQSSKEKNPADSIEEEEEDDDDSGDEFDMKQTEKPTKNERENEMSQMNQNRETKLSERNSDPNPWKNAGDAKKQWHRRLQMIQEHSAPESLEEKSLPKLEEKEDNEMDIDDANEQQFSSSDRQNNEPTTQTLGPANKDSDMIIPESLDDEEEDAEEPQVDSAMEEDMANKEEMSKEDITEADERQDMEEEEKPKEPLSDSRKKKKQKTKSNFEGNDNDDNANKMKSPLERLDSAESDPVIASNTDILASLSSSGMMLDEKKRELFMKKLINRGIKNNLTADDLEQGNELWSNAVSSTRESSQRLCEKLRLLLAPTLATKLQGDYRTGKRINMRKVIPFIASQFRKDAIWLRRTKPSKREYRVILALDNSKSMEVVGVLALQALALIAKSMTSLEVGKIGVYSFGDSIDNLHDLHSNTPLTDDIGGRIASHFQFKQDKTHIKESLITICRSFDENQVPSQLKNGSNFIETRQLVILISDGRFDSGGREDMKREIQLAFEKGQLVVLVIVEPPGVEGIENVVHVTYKKKVPVITKYLDNYPFPYYVIVKDAKELPETLADALRQWFELLSLTSG